jgi:hypothetical protein
MTIDVAGRTIERRREREEEPMKSRFWLLAACTCFACQAGTLAQVDPQQCSGSDCCITASCCHANAGRCPNGTCTCSYTCGGGVGSCSCQCGEAGPGEATLWGGEVSCPGAIQVHTTAGPATLKKVVRALEETTSWRYQVAPSLLSRRAEGDWQGAFDEVIEQIANAFGVKAVVDSEAKTIRFERQ